MAHIVVTALAHIALLVMSWKQPSNQSSVLLMPEVTHLSPVQKSAEITAASKSKTHEEASGTVSTVFIPLKLLPLYIVSSASIQE